MSKQYLKNKRRKQKLKKLQQRRQVVVPLELRIKETTTQPVIQLATPKKLPSRVATDDTQKLFTQTNTSEISRERARMLYFARRRVHVHAGNNSNKQKKLVGIIFALLSTFPVIVGCTMALIMVGYVQSINNTLTNISDVLEKRLNQSSRIYDRNGALLYTIYADENRESVPLTRIKEHTKWALLAAEDIDFYTHHGVDYSGVFSALIDYLDSKSLRGASTLTQQLARNVVLTRTLGENEAYERSFRRKITEALIAFKIEEQFTKEEILEIQMNEVFLGGSISGYQTAARAYFNKDVEYLTLNESAFLAGIIKSPTYYINAYNNGNTALVENRKNEVLDLMYKHRDMTKVSYDEYEKAKQEKIVLNQGKVNLLAPHFVFYVKEQLEKMYGADVVNSGGLKVTTTLDLQTQHVAENRLTSNIQNFKYWYGVNNGAVLIVDPRNGEILAMVGSVDYNNTDDKRVDGNVNVTVMPRQMGSSVKPYTYMAAFRSGSNPGTLAPDRPVSYGKYKPMNWDNRFYGQMSIRTALNLSRNVPAVYTLNRIGGPSRFISEVERLGITTLTDKSNYGLSIALGAGEMTLLEHTNAYGAFANSGVKYEPMSILEVKDSLNKVIYSYDKKTTEKRVYSTEETYLMNWVLCQLGNRKDKSASFMYTTAGMTFCGKTGTTTGPKDLVMIGYYPNLVVGVWTGNNNGQLTYGSRGQGWSENVPIKIMRDIMGDLIPRYGKAGYAMPAGVANGFVCKATGILTNKNSTCDKETTVYIKR